MFTVYILYSEKLDRCYTGTTDDVERRLQIHNSGSYGDTFSLRGIPWVLYIEITGLQSHQAYLIEKHIKKMKSRKYIENLMKFPDLIKSLKLRYQ